VAAGSLINCCILNYFALSLITQQQLSEPNVNVTCYITIEQKQTIFSDGNRLTIACAANFMSLFVGLVLEKYWK
jgi:hypothetical protein